MALATALLLLAVAGTQNVAAATVPPLAHPVAPQVPPPFATPNADGVTETINYGPDAGAHIPMHGEADGPVHHDANCASPDVEAPGRDPATFSRAELAHFGLPTPEQVGSVTEWAHIVHQATHRGCGWAYHYADGQPKVAGTNAVGTIYAGPNLYTVPGGWSGWVADAVANSELSPFGYSSCPQYCGHIVGTQGYWHAPSIQHYTAQADSEAWLGVGGTYGSNSQNCFVGSGTGHGLIQTGTDLNIKFGLGGDFLWMENTGSGYPSCGQRSMYNGCCLPYGPVAGHLIYALSTTTSNFIEDQSVSPYVYFSATESPSAVADSSECVAEWPVHGGGQPVETDFGMVDFQFCRATVNDTGSNVIWGIGNVPNMMPEMDVYTPCNVVYDFTDTGGTWHNHTFNVQYSWAECPY